MSSRAPVNIYLARRYQKSLFSSLIFDVDIKHILLPSLSPTSITDFHYSPRNQRLNVQVTVEQFRSRERLWNVSYTPTWHKLRSIIVEYIDSRNESLKADSISNHGKAETKPLEQTQQRLLATSSHPVAQKSHGSFQRNPHDRATKKDSEAF